MMDEVATIENELDQARSELHHTLEQVSQKIQVAGMGLTQPENVLRRSPLLSICLAGTAGLIAGLSRNQTKIFGAFATGLLAGYILELRSLEANAGVR